MTTQYNNKSLTPLQKAFLAIEKLQAKLELCQRTKNEPIAVIGIGCRFPGKADSAEQYWQMLLDEVDAVESIPEVRWSHSSFYDPISEIPGTTYVKDAAFLEQVDGFDADFFSIPPREANFLDPQQRLLLELAYETLQDAGIVASQLKNTQTGVFIGIGQQDYLELLRKYADNEDAGLYTGTGNGFCFASGRLSYHLGLQGPSISIDTACSSSLLAVHQACMSLRAQECNLALTGGVQLMLSPSAFVFMSDSKALAKDGRCKSFDSSADGYGRGEGAGMIALKRLSDAQRDEDRVLAVIRGSAVDHDGHSSGLTVPNGRAQQLLLGKLLSVANTQADELGYIETHGTGTSLGDPIEFNALAESLRSESDKPLLLGSVKTNIGHLEAAAGIAGLIKLILAIKNDKIPASLHFDQPNPTIPWQDYPIKVAKQAVDWPKTSEARVGIVSSFGLSGTNVQVLVAEQSATKHTPPQPEGSYIFKLSAKSESALNDWIQRHLKELTKIDSVLLADFCFSSNIARDDFSWRIASVVKDVTQLKDFLRDVLVRQQFQKIDKPTIAPVFMFAGQGSVKAGAGLVLYRTQPVFMNSLDACDEALLKQGQIKATELLFGDQAEALLQQTEHEQVALFALQYAMAKMWLSWGVKPSMLLGHSVGEYAAACIAGVFDVTAAIQILCCRSRLMQALPENGAMLAVFARQGQVQAMLHDMGTQLSIAAVNADEQVVVSGDGTAVQHFIGKAQQMGVQTKLLPVNRGFHSSQVDSVLSELKACLNTVKFNKPQFRYISSVTGGQEVEGITNAEYWRQHARKPVLFHQALTSAKQLGGNFFIELGAKPILTALSQQTQDNAFCSLDSSGNDWFSCQQVVVALYQSGYQLDWQGFYQGRRRSLMSLPNYPWQRQRYWFSNTKVKTAISHNSSIHPMLDESINTPLWSGNLYQGSIGCQQLPFLLDHKVFGEVVVAGACHLSALVAVGNTVFENKSFKIENIEFIEALQLKQNEQRLLQIGLTPSADNQYQLKVITLIDKDGTDYTEHMQALMVKSTASSDLYNLSELRQQCSERIDVQAFYQLLKRQEVQLGESFCWFKQLFKGQRRAIAEIRSLTISDKQFGIPPGLIDACFQLLGAAVPEKYTETYIPVAVHNMQITAENSLTNLWCYASFQDDGNANSGVVSGRVALFNEEGQTVVELSGITMRKADQKAMQQALMLDKNIYTVDWEKIAAVKNPEIEPMTQSWLVVGQALARKIAKTADWAKWMSLEDFIRQDLHQVKGVLLCMDGSRPDQDLVKQAEYNTVTLLGYLQKVSAYSEQTGLTIGVVSQQARLVTTQDSIDPTVELVSGLLRSFNHEYPLNTCQCLDFDQTDISLSQIVQILSTESSETEIALRSDNLFSTRLKITALPKQHAQNNWHGTYLLTGGSGALALQTAQWLVEKGINKLVLMSRNGLSEAGKQQMAELTRQGVEVHEVKADVADAPQVKAVLEQYGSDLRGIIHIAGVLSDGVIANIQSKQLEEVLKPKVTGLWNLHQYSRNLKLDCFIAYSSVAALLGAPGQGSYAAANSFMDAFMHWRHQHGLPGLSINWGPWAGSGMAERQQDSQLALTGMAKLSSNQAFVFLDQLFTQTQDPSLNQLGLFNVDWQQFKFNHSSLTKPLQRVKQTDQPLLSVQLSALPLKQRQRFLSGYLIEQVAAVLGLSDTGRLTTDIGFSELGMDSLMMLDLKNRLQKAVNKPLPSTLAFKYPTVDELLDFLVNDVFANQFTEQQKSEGLIIGDAKDDIADLLEQELLQLESEHIDD